jgi:ABC-2 type transport system permease protein
VTLGGLTAWKIGITELILVALMSLLTVVRHTRAEEEAGRLELLGATVLGRYAPLTAALLAVCLANVAIVVLIVLFLIGTGLGAAGALALGLAIGLTGVFFAAVGAVAAQLTQSARSANGIAIAVLGVVYLLRAVGDTGPIALTWVSPIGWALRMRPYAGERWWPAGLIVVLALALTAVAYRLVARRDIDAGLLPQRPGPAAAAPGLRGPFALAWRLQRGTLLAWVVAMLVSGAVMGGAAEGISHYTASKQVSDLLVKMGGPGALVDSYLAAVFGIVGLVAACYTVQVTLRLRNEEAAGRLEPLLATRVGRFRWAASHLVFALLGTAVLLVVAGLGGGLSYGAQAHDLGHQVPRLLAAAMVQLPAAWVLAGLGVALFGLVPRLTALTWAGLIACVVLLELGVLLGLSHWVVDASPFAHVPKLPGSAFTAMPLVWLTAVAVVLGAVGLVGFRRRGITNA